jgi:hypothetical protein
MGKGPWLGAVRSSTRSIRPISRPSGRSSRSARRTCRSGPSGSSPPLRAKRVGDLESPFTGRQAGLMLPEPPGFRAKAGCKT